MNKKINTLLEWSATTFTVLGAITTATAHDPLNIYLLNIGTILWLAWAIITKRNSLITVNASLLAVYVYGFIIRI